MPLEWEQTIVDATDPAGPGLLFVRVSEPKSRKNRLHLDFRPDDGAIHRDRVRCSAEWAPQRTRRRALRTLERCRRRVDDEPLKQQGAHLGNGLEPSVRCPLCGGPAREADGRFACEVGHEVDGDTMRDATDARLAEALWMAIEALDSEAEVQRLLGQEPFAAQAAEQAQLLRDFARLHGDHIDT